MKLLWVSVAALYLVGTASAQSLGDLARQERERKARMPKADLTVTSDELRGKLDVSPRLDAARKGDLDYLLGLLSHPAVSHELLAAIIPLKEQAAPKLLLMLGNAEPLKRVGPATVLTVLGGTDALPAMTSMLSAANEGVAALRTGESATSEQVVRRKIELGRQAGYAIRAIKLGLWRFTDGSALTPEEVVQRMEKGPPIDIIGGADNGQKIFSRALRDKDPNLRLGAIALVRVASEGKDFGFQTDKPPEQNESAIQEITTFLTTERGKVISQLGKSSH